MRFLNSFVSEMENDGFNWMLDCWWSFPFQPDNLIPYRGVRIFRFCKQKPTGCVRVV